MSENEYLEVAISNAFNSILRLADALGQSHTANIALIGLEQLQKDIQERKKP